MAADFLTGFPDNFLLECRVTMNEEDFLYWFEDHGNFKVVGYAKRELLWYEGYEHNYNGTFLFLEYEGKEYFLVFEDITDNTILASAGEYARLITNEQVDLLKKGLHCV